MAIKEGLILGAGAVTLPAQIFMPDSSGSHPAVIVAPGGMQQGEIAAYDWLASRLADVGYIALTVTYRAKQGVDDPRDIALALDLLERHPDLADRTRFGIFGHSRGGLAALRSAAQDSRLRAIVSLAAPTDLPQYAQSVASYAPSRYRDLVQWMGGTPAQLPDRYAIMRGLTYADRIRQPVLLVQGTLDMVTPLDHALWMERALKDAGNRRVAVAMIERMGHFCELAGQGYQFDCVAGITAKWFDRTLR